MENVKVLMGKNTVIEGIEAILQGQQVDKVLGLDPADQGKVLSIDVDDQGKAVLKAIEMAASEPQDLTALNVSYTNSKVPTVKNVKTALDNIFTHAEKMGKKYNVDSEAVVNAVNVPVTVKIRSGWDEKHINAVEVAKVCEKAGAKAITVHGRTRAQYYSGQVDLEIIKKVKEAVNIPVIGNGDVVDRESYLKMLEQINCIAKIL